MSVARFGLVVAAVVVGLLAYRVQVDNLLAATTPFRASATLAAAGAFLLAGLIAWARRPANRLGRLMIVACFALLAHQFRYSHDPVVFTVFFAIGDLGYALFAHTALAYPSGVVHDRVERAFLAVMYPTVVVFPLAILLVYDGSHTLRYFERPRQSRLLVHADPHLATLLQQAYVVLAYGCLASLFILLIARKLVRATPRARRLLAPLLLAAAFAALRAVLDGLVTFATPHGAVFDNLFWWQIGALTALPLALLAGLLRSRLSRVRVGDLVLELERTPPPAIRDALARALGDETLEVVFWLPERREFVDVDGRRIELPHESSRRAVTRLEHEGELQAALVHDPSLLDEPKLVEAAGAAASLALENARLHAEVRAQLVNVQESRARIVAAADDERRRIERDLHDGAQQRLVALALELRLAQRARGDHADPEVDRLLGDAVGELQAAVEELRELAHGVHPAILTEQGLAAALASLARRMPVPVSIEVDEERLSTVAEATAYFVASECLANVVKHSHATTASVSARRRDGVLVVSVEDDGVGGAVTALGSGLRGLSDRVEAAGGFLKIESPAGRGTKIEGEIPCAS